MTNYNLQDFLNWMRTKKREYHDTFFPIIDIEGAEDYETFTCFVENKQATYDNLKDYEWLRKSEVSIAGVLSYSSQERDEKAKEVIKLVEDWERERERESKSTKPTCANKPNNLNNI